MDNNFHIFPSETFIDSMPLPIWTMRSVLPDIYLVRQRGILSFSLCSFRNRHPDGHEFQGAECKLSGSERTGIYDFSGQITTYVADIQVPWEYVWVEFDGLRTTEILNVCGFSKDAPVYMAHSREARKKMVDELIYISQNSEQSPFHLMGHFYLFADLLAQSVARPQPAATSKMSDYYIKEAINFIEQNFQNDISIEDVAAVCGINRSYLGRIFRTSTGHSPQEFLIHYRMTKAAELLKLTTLSIGDDRLCRRLSKTPSTSPGF